MVAEVNDVSKDTLVNALKPLVKETLDTREMWRQLTLIDEEGKPLFCWLPFFLDFKPRG